MVIDTSALIAILLREEEAARIVDSIAADPLRVVGGPTLVEASAVMLGKRGPQGVVALDALLHDLDIEIVPMSKDAARLARDAYARYGKGVGSPGVLNFGDCLSYGVAKDRNEPLLFKGEDFPQTDVSAVHY
jgi:ribonuclease VapC